MKTQNSKLKTQNTLRSVQPAVGHWSFGLDHSAPARFFAWSILVLLLAVLTIRMTMTEALRLTLTQKIAVYSAQANPDGIAALPEIGPAVTTGLAALTLLCAAAAATAARKPLSRSQLGQLALIALIGALGLASVFQAANRFAALVGLCDVLMALVAGWTVSILCGPPLLGDAGRRFALSALVAILAAWCFKGFMQRFDEIPQMLDFYQHNKEKIWQQQGFRPGDPGISLFEGRLNSREVGGFITFSNVMAAGLIGLISITLGILLGAIRAQFATLGAAFRGAKIVEQPENSRQEREFPLILVAIITLGLLLLLAFIVLPFTLSKGGTIAAALCVVVILLGTLLSKHVARFRRAIIIVALILAALGTAGVITYGTIYDALPTKSLMFRWHYWTATVPIVGQSPVLGVGLNNFGDYYDQFKRPSSPEDVKDPHSYFIRLAAEMGVPAAALVGLLILWMALAATRPSAIQNSEFRIQNSPSPARPWSLTIGHWPFAAAALLLFAWTAHYFAEPRADWYLYMTVFYGLASALAFAAAWSALQSIHSLRPVLLAALVGVLGMLLYDQVNMALVTGPVAMLFWLLLGLAASIAPAPTAATTPRKSLVIGHWSLVIALLAAALSLLALVWLPLMRDKMAWDSAPLEWSYIRKYAGNDLKGALAELDAAAARAPRSLDLLRARIRVKQALHEPIADDIRHALTLDRANARPRKDLGLLESDLPGSERIAILKQALTLDAQLPKEEAKKLAPEDHTRIEATIEELSRRP